MSGARPPRRAARRWRRPPTGRCWPSSPRAAGARACRTRTCGCWATGRCWPTPSRPWPASGVADRLLISSDSEQVLRWAELHGHETHGARQLWRATPRRSPTWRPTSPRSSGWTATSASSSPPRRSARPTRSRARVAEFHANDADSLASGVREHHLFWFDERGRPGARAAAVRRAREPPVGPPPRAARDGVDPARARRALRARRQIVTTATCCSRRPAEEALDIDTHEDLVAARRRLEHGTVVFRVRANARDRARATCTTACSSPTSWPTSACASCCATATRSSTTWWPSTATTTDTETDLGRDLAPLGRPGRQACWSTTCWTPTEQEVLLQRSPGFRVVNIEDLGPGRQGWPTGS